ncbi:lymphocyte antigen 75-like isoform X5 [Syngnathus scovelli]|uniref:lymphocyte antigen 75-like isoform X5 n=1 Tax=Syngnathus scovelli TaxID=161590 RepID=UPI0035C99CBB
MRYKLKCVLLLIAIYGTCASASKCALGWFAHGTDCYKKVKEPNGWLGARHHCVWQGGDLVSITSSAEEDFVKGTMGEDTRFWLGLSNQKCDDVWCGFVAGSQELIWSDGNATTHTNWALDHFKSADVASCAYVNQGASRSPGKWRSGSCASSLAYMCKRPQSCPDGRTCTSKSVSAVMKTSDCADGNFLYGDDCYLFDATHRSWENGEKFCLARRGHLASVHSEQEAQFIKDHSAFYETWVGEKKKGNNYEWTDGTPSNDYKRTLYSSSGGACSRLRGRDLHRKAGCLWTLAPVCKTAKRGGPPQLPPLVGQPDWTQKCGWWLDDPTNDFCYLMIRQPTKTWQEAQADCKRLQGNLLSITDDHEQTFVHGYVKGLTNASPLWLGANVDVSAKGSKWADESLIEYVHSTIGTFDGNCLSFLTGTGDWKYDSCKNKRGYVCKKIGNVKATPAPDSNKCLPGWLAHDSSCYKKEMIPNGWLGAWHHCVWVGGNLLSITSSAEEDFVKRTMGEDTRFWLGLSNQKCGKVWCRFEGGSQNLTWSDNQTTTYTNWASNQLKSADVASCAYVNQGGSGEPGKWRSGSCRSSLAYMCKRPLSCPKGQTCSLKRGPAVVKTSDCQGNTFHYGDYCYRYEKTEKTFDDAEKFCRSREGHLASVHSKEEAQFVSDHSQTSQSVFVGLKKEDDDYEWSDGTTYDYDDWKNDTKGDCAFPSSDGELSASSCTTKRPFVCKRAQHGGLPQLPALVGQPEWTDTCGWWLNDPTNDFCYLMIRQPTKTWKEAQADCQRLHGNLLSITDDHEQTFVHGYVMSLPSLWLGADVSTKENDAQWTDGSPFTYIHSSAGDPGEDKCLSLFTANGVWKHDTCDKKRSYVCKKMKKGVAELSLSSDASKCAPGWLAHGTDCYKKVEEPNGWLGAWHHCVWEGGDLLSITTSAEEDFVKDTMGKDTRFWLGLSNQKCDDVWCRFEGGSQNLTWSDGENTTHTNWAPNQDESADVASCAYVNQGGRGQPGEWMSGSCDSSLAYMCKRPLSCPEGRTCSPKSGLAVVKTSTCDNGNLLYGDHCYFYSKLHKDWEDAEKFCVAQRGHLASVHSQQEAQFVFDHSQSVSYSWLGLKKKSNNYEYSDGTTFDYAEWQDDPTGDCAFPNSVGKIGGSPCTMKRPFVCKTAKREGPPQLPPLVGQLGWTDTCDWWLNDPTNNFCYLMIRQPTKTWKEAQADCQRLHGNLLSITDDHEQTFVHDYVMSLPSLWLGADVSTTEHDAQWTDGSPFTYIHSSAGDAKGGKCLSLSTDSGVWKHDTCDKKKCYVCKKMKKGVAELSLSSDASKCVPGWLEHGTNCYKKVEEPNGWLGAWHHCVWVGGNLLSVTSSAEEDFVKDTMGEDTRFWLGLSNQKCDDVWCRFEGGSQNLTWSDGETTTHTNWASNQLKSADVASCAYVNQGGSGEPGKWRSGSCRSSLAYMCKRPLSCPKGQTCSLKRGPAVVKTSDCQGNTFHYGDYCYRYEKTEKTFDDAEKFCRSREGHLASVHSKEEAQFVSDHSQTSQSVFVGLKKEDDDYEWSDGTTYDYDDWKNDTKGDCAFPSSDGELSASSCTTKRPFVCKRAQHGGLPQLPALVGQPEWTDTCGWWLNDPTNDFCYLMIRQPTKTWKEAQADCQRLHGNLLSITDDHEQTFVHGYVMSLPSLWLGADVSTKENDAQWTDGSPFTYIHSSAGDPGEDKCLSLFTANGVWKHDTCDKKRSYVCKKMKKGVAELSLSSDASKCAPGWLAHGTDCYKKVEEPNGWLGAWHHCVWEGGDLLSITTSAEEDFVKDTMGKDTRFWLGLSNQKCDDVWCRFEGGSQNLTWSDGENTTHTNWAPNQDESADVASCAYVNQGGRGQPGEWMSGSCDSSLAYMCKRPLSCPEGRTCSPKSGLAVVKTSTCDNGNLLYGDHCYFYSKLHKDWEDAEKFCVAQRGHLASVHSQQEAQFVFDHSQSVSYSWLGLKKKSNNYEYSDGTTFDYAEWQDDPTGDCAFPNSVGKIGGSPCTMKRPFVCKTAKRGGPRQLPPLASQQGWTDKCGWWVDNPSDDFCYLFNFQPTKTWQEAKADCKGRQGNLLSIADSDEQGFVRGIAKLLAMNDDASLWLGADASIKRDGDKWTDGSPFSYLHSSAGVTEGGKCLFLLTGSGDWKRCKCDEKRGYVCKKRGKPAKPQLPHDGYKKELLCQDDWKSLECPDERVIRIRSAFHGRKRSDVCPSGGGSRDDCRVEGALRRFRGLCDNYQTCPIYPIYLTDTDSCPGVSKYLHVVYSCEKKVCLDSLGIADGRIPDSSFSASSSAINAEPHKARLGGSGCWKPSKIFDSWIQVNLGQNFKVTGVKTQSCTYQFQSSSVFAMQLSIDGVTWYRHPVQPSVGIYLLTRPVFAQYVRLLPKFLGLRFDVLGCASDDTARKILCNSTATDLSLDGPMTVRCPLGCAQAEYEVYGTRTYDQDSNICAAAIHSGVIENEIGGDVTLQKRPPQKAYKGSTCNGINSTVYADKYAPSPSYTFADTEPRCLGSDWEEFADFCYKRFDDTKTWYGARHSCWGLDANLMSIRSEAERDWLQDLLKSAPGDTWTGLNDLVNRGRFVWSDRQKVPTFTNWAPPGKPTGLMENCVATLSQSGKWKKMSCMQLNGYVCKMPTARYPLDLDSANASCA